MPNIASPFATTPCNQQCGRVTLANDVPGAHGTIFTAYPQFPKQGTAKRVTNQGNHEMPLSAQRLCRRQLQALKKIVLLAVVASGCGLTRCAACSVAAQSCRRE